MLPASGTSRKASLRVAVRTLGCKVNQVESEQIAAELLADGATLVAEDFADVVIVNTCTVTGEADAKARKAVRGALGPSGRPVVVTGCLAALERAALEALGSGVVVEADKSRVAGRVVELLGARRGKASTPARAGAAFHTRAMLKIQDGCDSFCSYCIVPYARGRPRSVPAAEVRKEAESLVAEGAREIVLTGINLGRYRSGGTDLSALIREVAGTGLKRLRLSSIEPTCLDDELLRTLAETPAVCPHLHVPLQSGSDRVLAEMGRGYDLAAYSSRLRELHSALPGVAVTTDVIVGFPSETAGDARRTAEACEELGFVRLHVFRYSERAGTPAASRRGVVPKAERARRAATLREVDLRLRERYATLREGKEAEVLVESVTAAAECAAERTAEGTGERTAEPRLKASGTTEDYLKVSFEARDVSVGDIVRVRLGAAGRHGEITAAATPPVGDRAG